MNLGVSFLIVLLVLFGGMFIDYEFMKTGKYFMGFNLLGAVCMIIFGLLFAAGFFGAIVIWIIGLFSKKRKDEND